MCRKDEKEEKSSTGIERRGGAAELPQELEAPLLASFHGPYILLGRGSRGQHPHILPTTNIILLAIYRFEVFYRSYNKRCTLFRI
jgi:hypothetical protein